MKKKRPSSKHASKQSSAAASLVQHHPLDYIFNPKQTTKPYHLQGDPTYDSKESKQQRLSLRKSVKIQEALEKLVNLYQRDAQGNVTQEEYFRMYKLMCTSLRPNTPNSEMDKLAQEDWNKDTGNNGVLPVQKLHDALFDMADIWVNSTLEDDYLLFLTCLELKVKKPGAYNQKAYDVLF